MQFTVTLEGQDRLRAQLEALGTEAPKAIARALNRVLGTARTRVLRRLAADTGLPQKVLRPGLSQERATFTRQEATLRASARPMKLIRFLPSARPRHAVRIPPGLTVTPRLATSPFAQIMPRSGHLGIFKRRGRARGPIAELFGPSLHGVLVRQRIAEALRPELEAELVARLEHEIAFLATGRGVGAGGAA
jgi:hypothetical protein